ncbi:Macrocin-O-methyltransferase (TylF) [Natronoarchaeum philippinense]|uniref:Macrocin-O-methyltransferase (TylF) n=1 Tax=Natronoarchaeum philippinense TaxID=558529 RepID=A0A285P2M4_NATPI|nr:class I SAM-dependent methyltransferase [Natronoarchaeum philippinense]SNZ15994.1 Macrocin-O-methyltransferase (TylF) [Natronoarchaeum philippinense]
MESRPSQTDQSTDHDAVATERPAEPDQPIGPTGDGTADAAAASTPAQPETTAEVSDGSLYDTARRCYRLALLAASLPIVLGEYFRPQTGSEYGVGLGAKFVLAGKMLRNNRAIPTGSSFVEHLVMATKVLSTPADAEGTIVECGCYKGGSTANLSLVAGLADRQLVAFDCFEGMPEPGDTDSEHLLVASERVHTYEENSWSAPLEEAVENIETYGDPSAVTIHAGYFGETMPEFDQPVALAFLDVGLRSSAETAVEELWPLLDDDCYLFTHEAKHMEIASLFFESEWWSEHLDTEPPGLVGAGSGLGLHPAPNGFSSLLAYTIKNPDTGAFETVAETGEDNTVDASISKDA